jgi:uncharacterized membrane protein
VIVSRTFAVLAAAMAVLAVALIVLAPENLTLIAGLAQISPGLPAHLRHAILNALGERAWVHLFTPLMVRPVWLVPVYLCLLFAGISASTGWPPHSQRSTRSRS